MRSCTNKSEEKAKIEVILKLYCIAYSFRKEMLPSGKKGIFPTSLNLTAMNMSSNEVRKAGINGPPYAKQGKSAPWTGFANDHGMYLCNLEYNVVGLQLFI
ncbi:hypothetical protein llap_10006 [Limosa lapponica baueri]|uniref:Uncharacterized protein n=1 Tax=Limosa lapponica baueri TaxID=1758121 RepID=A0A2I0U0S8_LIMLA|nr:hypothetical protein llap_10006 [Limosa lapponica baueri]